MSLTTAIHLFICQSLCERRIPFEISLCRGGVETAAAFMEGDRIARDPSVKAYTNVDEMLAELKREAFAELEGDD